MGQLLFVEIVFCHQGIAFQNLSVRRTLPGGQAHGGAVQSSPFRNQLRRRLAGDGKVQLVLYEGIEGFCGLAVLVVVIAALFKHIGDLLIGSALAGPDLPDALQQFVEVVPAKGLAVFQHIVIEDKALGDVLFQCLGRPLAEPSGLLGVHPVAHGDDGVQVVVLQGTAHPPGALLLNCFHFGNGCVSGEFLLLVDILQVLGDGGNIHIEQLCHCLLGQPEGLVPKHNTDKLLLTVVVVEQDLPLLHGFSIHRLLLSQYSLCFCFLSQITLYIDFSKIASGK